MTKTTRRSRHAAQEPETYEKESDQICKRKPNHARPALWVSIVLCSVALLYMMLAVPNAVYGTSAEELAGKMRVQWSAGLRFGPCSDALDPPPLTRIVRPHHENRTHYCLRLATRSSDLVGKSVYRPARAPSVPGVGKIVRIEL